MKFLKRLLQDYGGRVMAVVGALLMVTYFFPNGRNASPSDAGRRTYATVYGNHPITYIEEKNARDEWDTLRRMTYHMHFGQEDVPIPMTSILELPSFNYLLPASDEQAMILRATLQSHRVVDAIDADPHAFLMLVHEAEHLGITVSADQYNAVVKNNLDEFPADDDSNYDRMHASVVDILLVRNLLDRIGEIPKMSQPRTMQALAQDEQTAALNVVELPADRYLAATTQPTDAEISAQYHHYAGTVAGKPTADNPLGFGYALPDRAKIQDISISLADVQDAAMHAVPTVDPNTDKVTRLQPLPQSFAAGPNQKPETAIEWEVRARRLYRTHMERFPVAPATAPSTRPVAATQPDFDHLPADTLANVYKDVYQSAANDLMQLTRDRLNSTLAADYAAYAEARAHNQPAPPTAQNVPITSNDYLPAVALSIQHSIGILPTVAIFDKNFLTAKDLAALPGIGQATNSSGTTLFATAVLQSGSEFVASESLMESQRLAQWQPSPLFFRQTDGGVVLYIFRISAMEASHSMNATEAHEQVIADLHISQAWQMALADAGKLVASAKKAGLSAAAMELVPGPGVITTDYFNLAQANQPVPGIPLSAESAITFRQEAVTLLTAGVPTPTTIIKLPLDRKVDVVELKGVRAGWQNSNERLTRELELTAEQAAVQATQLELSWVEPKGLTKRTQFVEAKN